MLKSNERLIRYKQITMTWGKISQQMNSTTWKKKKNNDFEVSQNSIL